MTAQPYLVHAINWQKYTAAEWVEQFGAWVRSERVNVPHQYTTPLASMIDKADTSKARKSRPVIPLKISDDEARAVQRVLLGMLNSPDPEVSYWAWVLILRYEGDWSWSIIADTHSCSVNKVRQAEKEGLAFFRGRLVL